ncbi:MAG: anti-sigma-factor antagonist [Actinomycetia bacterium]|nr:anti-sigma-factor antagonist [Actinomycetes bacterium]
MTSNAEFTVAARPAGQDEILQLRGELDMANAHDLRRHIRAVLNDRDPPRLILDLAGLDFVDSSGLAVMLWAHFRLAERGHVLCLAAAHAHVLKVLHLTGLHQRLHTYPALADALRAPLPAERSTPAADDRPPRAGLPAPTAAHHPQRAR